MAINDDMLALKQMAEAAADSCIKETAGIVGVPEYFLYKNLSMKGLRLLCISVAHEAMAAYAKKQYEKNEAQLAEMMRTDVPQHPGC
jgi:hypothetical protein